MQVMMRIAPYCRQDVAFILPVVEVAGGIAGDSLDIDPCPSLALVAFRGVRLPVFDLSVPVIDAVVIKNPAPVGIYRIAIGVQPELTRVKAAVKVSGADRGRTQGYARKRDGDKAGQYKATHLSQSGSLHSCKAQFSVSLSPSGSGSMQDNRPLITIATAIPIPKFWTSRPAVLLSGDPTASS
jgi:hypothetical protein